MERSSIVTSIMKVGSYLSLFLSCVSDLKLRIRLVSVNSTIHISNRLVCVCVCVCVCV